MYLVEDNLITDYIPIWGRKLRHSSISVRGIWYQTNFQSLDSSCFSFLVENRDTGRKKSFCNSANSMVLCLSSGAGSQLSQQRHGFKKVASRTGLIMDPIRSRDLVKESRSKIRKEKFIAWQIDTSFYFDQVFTNSAVLNLWNIKLEHLVIYIFISQILNKYLQHWSKAVLTIEQDFCRKSSALKESERVKCGDRGFRGSIYYPQRSLHIKS